MRSKVKAVVLSAGVVLLLAPMLSATDGSSDARLTPADVPAIAEMERLGGCYLTKGLRASWSPDGERLAFALPAAEDAVTRRQGIAIFDLGTGAVERLTDSGRAPAWSPGEGRWIAYVQGDAEERTICLISPSGGKVRELCSGAFPYWADKGRVLYFHSITSPQLMSVALEDEAATPTPVMEVAQAFPAVDPDGRTVAYRSGAWLQIADVQTGKVASRHVLPGGSGFFAGDFSPDGRYLAFAGGDKADIRGLRVLDLETGKGIRLTDGPFNMPSWSKDGKRLAFNLRSGAGSELWMIDRAALESGWADTFAVPEVTPSDLDKLEVMSEMMLGFTAQKEAVQSEYARRSAAVRADYQEQLSAIGTATREIAERICELESDHTSEVYVAAFEVTLPEKLRGLASLDEAGQRSFIEDLTNYLAAKDAKLLTTRDVATARTAARALATAGRESLAAQAYKDLSAALGRSSDRSVASYRERYLDAEARKLEILGSPMQLAGTTVRGERPFDLSSYRGKIVLVDFWATWCPPCRAELPNMKRCYEAYKDRGFTIVGVSLDRDRSALERYLEEQEVPWVNLHEKANPGRHPAATRYGITAIPTMYLVDRDGSIISTTARGTRLVSLLAEHLAAPSELAKRSVRAEDWKRAAELLSLQTAATPSDADAWSALAVSQLMAGDQAGFQTTCGTAQARLSRSSDAAVKLKLVRLCCLASNPVVRQPNFSTVADSLPEDFDPASLQLTRGMLDYRQGRMAEARKRLETDSDGPQAALSRLFHAMATYQLGDENEARKLYQGACRQDEPQVPAAETASRGDTAAETWFVRAMVDAIRREADALLSGELVGSEERILYLTSAGKVSEAVEELSQRIKESPTDTALLRRRCNLCIHIGGWETAAKDLVTLAESETTDSIPWLRAATVLARSGNTAEHGHFCKRMLDQFGESDTLPPIERIIKASLLLPASVDPSTLPIERLQKAMEGDRIESSFAPWGWATCALVAYRRGDLDGVLQCVKRAEDVPEYATIHRARMLALFLKSLALHETKKYDEARATFEQADELLQEYEAQHEANSTWNHDDMIAELLKGEIRVKLNKTD